MIIEIIGPGGVGKTTVEPLVAERLGIRYYPGQKRRGFQGEELSGWRLWSGRVWSVMRRPGLSMTAWTTHNGSLRERAWFIMDICRRETNAARSRRLGSGVVASGPIHALCMMSGATGADVSSLQKYLTKADVYVRLEAEPGEVARRLAGRLGQVSTDLDQHADWMVRYDAASDRILQNLERPVVDVRADVLPDEVADEIAARLAPFLD